jgi:DNA-binding beta-propeller fold protein YncE
MKTINNTILLYAALLLTLSVIPLKAQPTSYRLVRETNLNRVFGAGYANTVKMFDIAYDDRRNLAYTHGFPTGNVAVVNLVTQRHIGSVRLPIPRQLTKLSTNPVNGFLLVTTPEAMPVQAYLIDPADGLTKGTYRFSGANTGVGFDRMQNRIFVSDGTNVKVLDGATLREISTLNTQIPPGGLAVDSSANELYVAARDPRQGSMEVRVYALGDLTLARTYTISTSVPLGSILIEPARQRFFLVGRSLIKRVDYANSVAATDIRLPAEINSVTYLPDVQTLYAADEDGYIGQGTKGTWSKLYRFHLTTNRLDSSFFGDKVLNLVADSRRNFIAGASMHSSHVHILSGASGRIDSVDIAETLDDITATPDGEMLYGAKRLGGSRIVAHNTRTGATTEFAAGNWPALVFSETLSGTTWVYAVNMLESSVSFIRTSNNQIAKTLPLGTAEPRTDAIVSGALDARNNLLYIAIPELSTMVVINTATQAVSRTATIPRYVYDETKDKAVGRIQIAVAPDLSRVFMLLVSQKILLAYNTTSQAWDSVNLGTTMRYPQNTGNFESNMLAYDQRGQRLFVGNQILNPTTFALQGQLSQGHRFLGYNSTATTAYSLTARGDTLTMIEHNPTSLQVQATRALYVASDSFTPIFSLDSPNNALFMTNWNHPVIRHFDMRQTAPLTTSVRSAPNTSILSIAPHPASDLVRVQFTLPKSERVSLKLFNALGQEVAQILDETLSAGEHEIPISLAGFAQTTLIMRVESASFQTHKIMQIIR